ncbi:MAG: hypothetical protein AAF587_18400 [Bacteroidota bacterium]
MYKIVLLLGWLTFLAGSVFSQMYSGPNQATFSSTGSAQTSSFDSPAMTGRYMAESQSLVLMAKTGAIPLGASQADQDMFQEVFLPPTNPLLTISIDLSSLSSGQQTVSLPAQIMWNDQVSEQTVSLTIDMGAENIQFDLEAELALDSFQIIIPTKYADRFSNECSLVISGATLHRR